MSWSHSLLLKISDTPLTKSDWSNHFTVTHGRMFSTQSEEVLCDCKNFHMLQISNLLGNHASDISWSDFVAVRLVLYDLLVKSHLPFVTCIKFHKERTWSFLKLYFSWWIFWRIYSAVWYMFMETTILLPSAYEMFCYGR